MVTFEAKVQLRKILKTAHKQQRTGYEEQRQRDLTGDQQFGRAQAGAALDAASGLLQRMTQVDIGGPKSRRESKDQDRREREQNREEQDTSVEREREWRDAASDAERHPHQQCARPLRQEKSDCCSQG